MPIPITIGSTVIQFPVSADSPNWAPAVTQFAESVADALSSVIGVFDVPPQTFVIDSYNPGTNIVIPNFSFSTSAVRGVFIKYTVYRTTSAITVAQGGYLEFLYNNTSPANTMWQRAHQYSGDASITFTMTDAGVLEFSTTILSGINHSGQITLEATALLQE